MHKVFLITFSTRPINVIVKKQLNNFNVHALPTLQQTYKYYLRLACSLSSEIVRLYFGVKYQDIRRNF